MPLFVFFARLGLAGGGIAPLACRAAGMGSTGALVAILAFLHIMVASAAFMLVVFMAVGAAMVVLHDDC